MGSSAGAETATHPPTLSAITPTTGIAGTTVTVTGTYLSTETAVHFGKALATTVTVKSADKLLAVAPAGKGTVKIWVKTPTGISNSEPFTYKAPTLTLLSPKTGHPGATLTLRGTGFSATATVDFAGEALSGVTVKSVAALSVAVPTLTGVKKKTTEPVVVHTAAGTSQALSFAYEPPPALKVTTTSLPAFVSTQQQSYGPVTLTSSGGTAGAKTWSVGAGFPEGLSLTGSSGVISGRPEKPSTQTLFDDTYHFTVTVKDAAGKAAAKALTLTVVDEGVNFIYATTPPVASLDSPYSASFTAQTEIASPFKTTHATDWTQRGLPPGLSITSYWGTVTGAPTEAGTFPVVVSDSYGGSFFATAAFTLTVQGFHITTTRLAGYTSTFFGQSTTGPTTLEAVTGTGTIHWSATGLPGGLSINTTTGTISGSPGIAGATIGTHTFTATATDAKGSTTQSVTVQITQGQFVVETGGVTPAYLTTPYDGYPSAYGQVAPGNTPSNGIYLTRWSATGLPPGLSITSVYGTIYGTPTQAGTAAVTIIDENVTAFFAEARVTLTVSALHITGATLAGWTTMESYPTTSGATQFQATGGTSTLTWSVGTGFPEGLTLTTTSGEIEPASVTGLPGAPDFAGTYHFTVSVMDGSGGHASRSFTLTVTEGSFHITTVGTDDVVKMDVDTYFSGVFIGETSPTRCQVGSLTQWFSTGLPPGLTLEESGTYCYGVLFGTPTNSGTYTVTARDRNAASNTWATTQFTVDVYPALTITTTSLPEGRETLAYPTKVHPGVRLAATGGQGTYTWSATGLPKGLSISKSGVLSGTPHASGTFSVKVTVTDGSGSDSRTLSLSIGNPLLTITTKTMAPAGVTKGYSFQLVATGGTGSNTWSLTSSTSTHRLPSGFSLSASGVVSGKTGTAGVFTVTVKVTDTGQTAATATVRLTVYGPLHITTTTLPPAHFGHTGPTTPGYSIYYYSVRLSASGGTPTKTWSITGGVLPTGFTVVDGILGGYAPKSSAGKTYHFTVEVTDKLGTIDGPVALSLYVTPNTPLSVSTQYTPPPGTVGKPYSTKLVGKGGTGSYTWTWKKSCLRVLTTGKSVTKFTVTALGLTLASTGKITGTPTESGAFDITVTLTDKLGTTVTWLMQIRIAT